MKRFILIVFALLLSSCGWKQKSESTSPDGVNRVVLLQQRVFEMGGGLQIRFMVNSRPIHTEKVVGDFYISFIEYFWSDDSTKVAVYINGLQRKGFAYDFSTRADIPFESMKDGLEEKIRREYHLARTDDPLTCLPCMKAFTKEHPSAVTH